MCETSSTMCMRDMVTIDKIVYDIVKILKYPG